MSYEDLETLVTGIKDKVDEKSGAVISEDLLGIMSNYKSLEDGIKERDDEIKKLQADKDELLAVNGRLFQKIGFDKQESPEESQPQVKEEMRIEEIINEKGELI